MIPNMVNDTLLITGETGSFGKAVLERYLNSDIGEIRVFSRDEEKQDRLRQIISDERVKFIIGDVRDRNSVWELCMASIMSFMLLH